MQWHFIKDKVQEVTEKHIPTRKVKTTGNRHKFPINAYIREIIMKKHRSWERYGKCNYTDGDKYKTYHRLRNKVWKAT